jgi:hypothetical protein
MLQYLVYEDDSPEIILQKLVLPKKESILMQEERIRI